MIKDSLQLKILDFAIKKYDVIYTKFNANLVATVLSNSSASFMKSFSRKDEIGMMLHYCYFIVMLRCFQANFLSNSFEADGSDYKKALDIINGATNQGFLILEILSKALPINTSDIDLAINECLKALRFSKKDGEADIKMLRKSIKGILCNKGIILENKKTK
ncbi:hypothetical protein [Campylobacter hyointestinalis]|uniref:hypothetical protein n=1 Tax=Campylobacter hyointestinalis TaxID=198 RepID=UPI000723B7CC|nr:hypothetical protein [Campylobacter hyointestinalis]CUU87575.1 Uncharacterised protein [Campylobacter hyointestinalis subsp. hyointestinalis]